MVQVTVVDKLRPRCTPPADVTVLCDAFDPTLESYGAPQVTDNCCLDTVVETLDLSHFDSICNNGLLVRLFAATDCAGQSSACSQRISVVFQQNYFIKFPDDRILTQCDPANLSGEPQFFGENCELLASSFEDEVFTLVPDACYRLRRKWKIINWCNFDPEVPCIKIPNPDVGLERPVILSGPIVSAPNTGFPWNATVIKILPSDAAPTDFSTFWDPNANCYQYDQVLLVTDKQDPTINGCQDPDACAQTTNDPGLWNDGVWWDPKAGRHDLCEAPLELSLSATDGCTGANLQLKYLLELDLDGDGETETVVTSQMNLPPGMIPYGNANTPNYSGGTLLPFDNRPVAADQKYRFSIETSVSGTERFVALRWNTTAMPFVFVKPQLPHGYHRLRWIIEDGCGNERLCEQQLNVRDCKPPTAVCINGLAVNLMPVGMVTLWSSDFLQYAEDNCTPAPDLDVAVIESAQSTGMFPLDSAGLPRLSVTFNCGDLGPTPVQLWVRDKAGNASFCETFVNVQDNAAACGHNVTIAGTLLDEPGAGVEAAEVRLEGNHPALPPLEWLGLTDSGGYFAFDKALPVSFDALIRPFKNDNPLNGVSTYDLVLINRHILGVQPLNTPYKIIAADANKSGSVTTADVVELRKLILGQYTALPANTSWRFIDKSYVFPDPANPFQPPFPEEKTVANAAADQSDNHFTAIKIGDVNQSAVATTSPGGSANSRWAEPLFFKTEEQVYASGETVRVFLEPEQSVEGYQFTIRTEGLDVVEVEACETCVHPNQVALRGGALSVSCDNGQHPRLSLLCRSRASGALSESLRFDTAGLAAEAYLANGKTALPVLQVVQRKQEALASKAFVVQAIEPNPFYDAAHIDFFLPGPAACRLRLWDVGGRLLSEAEALLPAGNRRWRVDGMGLPAGLLQYTLETPWGKSSGSMLKKG